MPYVDLAGLSRYASRQKDRLERDYALLRDMQWTRSEKAGAVSLWPVGGTPLKPTVDFMFTETPPAEGDKGPDNPSTITGVLSVGVRQLGANFAYIAASSRLSLQSDGYYSGTVNNTGSSTLYAWVRYLQDLDMSWVDRTKNYCCVVEYENCDSFSVASYSSTIGERPLLRGLNGAATVLSGTGKAKLDLEFYETDSPSNLIRMGASITAGTTANYKFRIAVLQCTAAEVDLNTYKYDAANNLYTIPLGGTYYGGTLDVSTGVMTVTWVGKVFDGMEPFRIVGVSSGSTRFVYDLTVYNLPVAIGGENNSICSHAVFVGNIEGVWGNFNVTTTGSSSYFYMQDKNEVIASLENYVSWVAAQYSAGTPLTMAYKIATPYTVQLTPTQILSLTQSDKYTPRLNTIYTDAKAVQVGYVKSPIREEYELQQAVIAQGGNV